MSSYITCHQFVLAGKRQDMSKNKIGCTNYDTKQHVKQQLVEPNRGPEGDSVDSSMADETVLLS